MYLLGDLKTRVIVYYDDSYPSSWINERANYPFTIAKFLNQNRDLEIVDATTLRDFMVEGIQKGDCHTRLVIFSQDVVPNTVIEDYFTNPTLREYLDEGGSILWIGDIPLWYVGKPERQIDDAWKRGAPFYMLGIIPLFTESPKQPVEITDEGRRLKLRHRWSGRRPIFEDSGITVLARSEVIAAAPYCPVSKKLVAGRGFAQ